MSENKNITILFVAFEFPPLGSGGVLRSMKWVTYLPEFGIKPVVMTIEEDDISKVFSGAKIDSTLLHELPKDVTIKRVHCESRLPSKNKIIEWFRIFFSVSEVFKSTWKKGLEKSLPEIIETYKPDAVYVTIPPFAMASLWRKMLKSYSIPLIVDFRDAWSQWCVNVNGTYFHYLAKLIAERKILKRADAVICTSTQISNDLQKVHPMINPEKFNVITNGFDQANIPELKNIDLSKNKTVIGYVGSFYYTPTYRDNIFKPWWKKPLHRMLNYVPRKEDWLYRSPYFFFKSLKKLFEIQPEWKDRIEIRFAGHTPNWLKEQIESFGLTSICKHYGFLDHQRVIEFQKECDALLITSSKVIGGRDYSIAGKTFEYFTIGKPIIAFVCDGVQKDLLQQSGMAFMFDPDETSGSAHKLKDCFEGKITLTPDASNIMQYHRKNLTEKLSNVIREAVKQHQ
jgi:hypothetical protein